MACVSPNDYLIYSLHA